MAMSPTKSQTGSRSFTRALALAFNEWLLMLMLFANSIFTYVITRFADYSELQSPCLMCTRLDHILGKTKHLNKKTHWDMICSKHKSEISSLVYCHAHGKLVDVRGMCETCLFSFATTNKSNAETYRLLVGKLGEDTSCFGSKSDQSMNPRYCTCCNQLCMPQTASTQVAKPETLPKIRLRSGLSTGKQSTTPKKSVSFNDLPHVGYTELKFHSDTESEAVFSEDEGLVREEHHHKFQTMNLDIPPVITLPYDLATDKLLNLDFSLKHLHEIGLGTNSLFPELIPVSDVPGTSEKVLKEEEIISLDNLFLTSRAMEHFGAVLEEKEELFLFNDAKIKETVLMPVNGVSETSEKVLKEETSRSIERCAAVLEENEEWIRFNDVSLTPDALLEETELIPVNDVPETSEKVLKEEEIISFDNPFLTPRATEYSAAVLEEKEELIRLNDVSLTPIFKAIPEDALMEETELICLNDVTSTSVAAETREDVLKGTELMSLRDISLHDVPGSSTTNEASVELSKQSDTSLESEDIVVSSTKSMPENTTEKLPFECKDSKKVVKEEEITSLDNLFLTSRATEPSAVILEETEDLSHLQNSSITPDFKENPATALTEETELICLNDATSTSSDAVETPEDVLKGIELMSLHDISIEEVPESFTTNETSVETPKERDTNQEADITSLESEEIVVSSTQSMPENSTEKIPFECKDSEKAVKEEDIISLDNNFLTSLAMEPSEAVSKEKEELICLQDVSLTPDTEEKELICLNDVTLTSSDASETHEDVLKGIELTSLHDIFIEEVPESFTTNETSVETLRESEINEADINSLESEYIVVSPTKSMPENSTEYCVLENKEMEETSLTVSSVSELAPPGVTSHTKAPPESESSSFNSMSVAAETNQDSGELMDLADAYNNIVSNEGNKDSNGAQIEQWMKKDTSRVSEDLKALLTQISASRGIEFLSPRDISPRICSDQETKDLDHDMQLLLQKRMLERNESNLSLEGVSVSEIEGESESDRLKRQVDHDRKLLSGLYKELEEERSASAVATNQAMAMITRLQEEKALFQMEALQNLRMMEEQAEYDMEAIQKLNDLLVEREKLIQDLEAEIDYFPDQTPQKKDIAEKVTGIDSPSKRMSNKIQSCLTGFNEERLYITSFLEKIENRVVNGEADVDNLATQESISELHERVEKLNGDLYFLEQVVNSLGHGNEGVQFVKEIASHLQTLRSLSMKRQDHTES